MSCVCLGMVYTDGEERETDRQRERGSQTLVQLEVHHC